MTLVFKAVMSENDVTLCKLGVNVKNERGSLVPSTSLNLSRNSLKEKKCLFIASPTLKIKCGKSKGMQGKLSVMGVWCG